MTRLADATDLASTTSTLWREKRRATQQEWSDSRRREFDDDFGEPLDKHNDEVTRVITELDQVLTTAMTDLYP